MKTTLFAGVLAALGSSTAVLAQTYLNQSGPFLLKLVSSNRTLDGQYLGACHAGAAVETLCLIGNDSTAINREAATFFWNYTLYDGRPSDTGLLIWNLELTMSMMNVSESMAISFAPNTNVATLLFTPSPSTNTVGFNGSELYVPAWADDSTFRDGEYPNGLGSYQLTNWHACWLFAGTYYYNALAWVAGGVPHNPTCQPVGVVREDLVLETSEPAAE
ncbi:hypothetical protein B0H63DRAFT_372113, partial [Podospora didyma]